MTVDLKPESGGRWHFSLGPVEKWVAAMIAAGAVAMTLWLVASVQTLLTQQALTNQQLQTISAQISGVPALNTQVVELKVRVDQHDQEIRELKQLRGMRQ